jgi:hypothetical protein
MGEGGREVEGGKKERKRERGKKEKERNRERMSDAGRKGRRRGGGEREREATWWAAAATNQGKRCRPKVFWAIDGENCREAPRLPIVWRCG